jgi:hypothetical protein
MRADPKVRRFRVSTAPRPNRPGTWDSTVVTVYDGDVAVGEYVRNYPRYAAETFEPFELNGSWYALYSREYTGTRVMTLPDCRDIGGEEPHGGGFCPVELFVPRYRERTLTKPGDPTFEPKVEWIFEGKADAFVDGDIGHGFSQTAGPWQNLDVAFVAGCVWGDDSSWKLQVIDLTRAHEGILTRSERFGFVELGIMPLANAIQCHKWNGSTLRATIIRQEQRDLRTGAYIDPYE